MNFSGICQSASGGLVVGPGGALQDRNHAGLASLSQKNRQDIFVSLPLLGYLSFAWGCMNDLQELSVLGPSTDHLYTLTGVNVCEIY